MLSEGKDGGCGRRVSVGCLTVSALSKPAVIVGSLGIVATGSAVLFLFDPSTSDFYPPCPFRALTGFYCPGCGTTRALHALLHGHLGEAFGLNPLMVLMLPFLAYSLLSYATFRVGWGHLPGTSTSPLWGWLAFWVILVYWILRNIPFYPFSLLAP
jgi:hypothetical protein